VPLRSNRLSKSKCTKVKLINQKIKGNKSSLGNHISTMIDECGNEEDGNNRANVDFVQEWINTYTFISREFILSFNFYFDFINTCEMALKSSTCKLLHSVDEIQIKFLDKGFRYLKFKPLYDLIKKGFHKNFDGLILFYIKKD
jgi:hypothetical protein